MTQVARTFLSMRQMLLLASIEDNGSLKRAAERVGISQPRATKALQEAEEALDKKLFNRTNRGMVPTAAGQCVIRHAKTMMAQCRSMEQELEHLAGEDWQRLRVGTIMGAVPYVTKTIQRYLQRYPRTSIEILEDTSAELLRQLDRGALDLVIGRNSVSDAPHLHNVVAFHDERLSVVANSHHLLVGRKRVDLKDLQGCRWIVYTSSMPMRISLEQEFRIAGLSFPTSLFETRSALATMSLIQNDADTVALLSSDVASFFVSFGMARILPVQLQTESDAYEIITRKFPEIDDRTESFKLELILGANKLK